MKIKEMFDNLDPAQKKWVILLLLGLGLTGFGYLAYTKKQASQGPALVAAPKAHQIGMDEDLIEKSLAREQRAEAERIRKEMAAMQNKLEELESRPAEITIQQSNVPVPPPPSPTAPTKVTDLVLPTPDDLASRHKNPNGDSVQARPTPPPPSGNFLGVASPTRPISPPAPPAQEEIVGGIGFLKNPEATAAAATKDTKKKEQKERSVYLPPSFMTAELISGGDISTSGNAESNPEPFFLRVQTPAILPNDVKLNLKACFIVAEGTGRLDKERAIIRTVSISCLSKNGQSVIDEDIKGYVADADAKNGLTGRVYAKWGASLARTFIAGGVEGAGDAFKASATSQTTSGITGTTTSVVDTSQLTKSAVGGAMNESAGTLKDLYLDLVKQSTPVIEINSARKVTVFITQGVELKIKEIPKENRNDM